MRIIRAIFILMATALICDCSRLDENLILAETQLTITAGFAENANTKTTLQGNDVYWEVGDEIKVFYGDGYGRFCSVNTEETVSTQFSGSINVDIGDNEDFARGEYMWGLYPYRSDATYDGTAVTTTIPNQQTGKAGSFAKNMNISLARSSNLALAFFNVCGGVRFSVTRDDVKEVSFKALNGESIAGKVKLCFDGGVPVVSEVIEGKDSIMLTAPGGGVFETGKWYYIVVLPGTLSGGFTMKFNTETKFAVLSSTAERTVKRGVFGSIGEADDGLEYKDIPGPGEGNIVFKDSVAKMACVEKFDSDGDGELSYVEAAAVTSIAGLFTDYNSVTRFDELKYFTGITGLESALKGLKNLRSVTIPAGFTSLENEAFSDCSALDSITFAGNAVKTIGDKAFNLCTSLKEIILPSAVQFLGHSAFYKCTSLESIDIPSGVTSIPNYCFQACSALRTIGIPSGVKSIGFASFELCRKLDSVDFPSGLTSVDGYAFSSCKSLRKITLPSAVESLSYRAFSGCSALESATLPSGLTSLPIGIFAHCTALFAVTFPTALISIEAEAFYNCPFYNPSTKVSKLELPETVTSIGKDAFNRVRNVLVHTIPMVSIETNTFSKAARLFVPDSKVETYKIRANWSSYADHIFALSSYTDNPVSIEAVDLGLSVKWASCNVGALWEDEYGNHYAWGEIETKSFYSWNSYKWCNGSETTLTKYCTSSKYGTVDEKTVLELEDDVAHVKWGGSWRMPTDAEWTELRENCTWTWTTIEGVKGRLVTSNKPGYTDKSIFLPAAGDIYRDKSYGVGTTGYYMSSSLSENNSHAWDVLFSSTNVMRTEGNRYGALSVRPVTE